MCQHSATGEKLFEKKFSLAEFFNAHWTNYVASPKTYITKEQFKAVNAIRLCRTSKLGKDVYSCKDCGNVVELYHSCKNRFCPNCSWTDTLKWADKVFKKLMNVPHRHVVMTLPHALNLLIPRNRDFFYGTLMTLASNIIKDYIIEKYRVFPGVITVLHTFGEKKGLHVHVHMIVSWGGIDQSGNTLKSIPVKDHVSYMDLKERFRLSYINAITHQYRTNQLNHDFSDETEFNQFISSLQEKQWIIHLEPPMDMPEQIIRYIGRYSKRACLSEHKITNIEGEYISFKYKDYKEQDADGKPVEKILRLHYRDFFPLLLQHVPLKNFRLVRYYGSYSTKTKLAEEFTAKPDQQDSGQQVIEFNDTEVCSECHGPMCYIESKAARGSVNWFIYRKIELIKHMKKIAA